MQPAELYTKYFATGTRGYNFISRYYYKYRDLFERTEFPQLKEFLNQIYVNISDIDFSKDIRNPEAYIIGSIKIQCRVQLDKALKAKNRSSGQVQNNIEENENSFIENVTAGNPGPLEALETQEILAIVNIFKLTLKIPERQLFNFLLDDMPRKEIAERNGINLNTLDTRIRRLRIKFLTYLKKRNYSFSIFKKFEE